MSTSVETATEGFRRNLPSDQAPLASKIIEEGGEPEGPMTTTTEQARASRWAAWKAEVAIRQRFVFKDGATTAALIQQAGRDAAAAAQRAAWRWLEEWSMLSWDTLTQRATERLLDLGRTEEFVAAMFREEVNGRWTRARLADYALTLEADRCAILASERATRDAGIALSARHRETDEPVFATLRDFYAAPASLRDDVILAADAWARLRREIYDDDDDV